MVPESPPFNRDARDGAFVARQPIFDAFGQVFGYELLYRAAAADSSCHEELDVAAARVLNDAVLTLGLETLTGDKRAFINLTRHVLLGDFATLLRPSAVVLEVLENVVGDEAAVSAVKRLRRLGYSIALDDFTLNDHSLALLPYATYVKVDVLATTPQERREIRAAMPPWVTLLAEKVESPTILDELRAASFALFQGHYFCRPRTFAAGTLTTRHIAYSRLLAAVCRADATVAAVEEVIKSEAALAFRVLRCINSAAFGIRREIRSIREALVLLGLDQVRKWALVWGLAGRNLGTTPELVTMAILRARCCELVAQTRVSSEDAAEYFLLGLCSVLDALLDRPMEEMVEDLPLSATIRGALLGEQNEARLVLDTVTAYERGQWDEATTLAHRAGIHPERLPVAYADALRWARQATHMTAA